MTRMRVLVSVVVGLLFAGATAAPASAETGGWADADPQIVEMMAEVPGGVLLDATHAVWPELGMELIVPESSIGVASMAAVGPCATGRICAYSGQSLTGSVLTFSTCGIHAIPSSFRTRSLANARSSGYTQARNGTTVLATAWAGGWTNVYGTATNLRCVF
ncbi:hypothetical protein [Microbacterium sp. SD291]|uniref:hypothetical protein n=1 Tax=Microbacterium sp. SD291 TaxID=2782007 RepID=UPI001A97CA7B|nr:hypothetical protein [Microbacterium sp. SD291]MBO0981128.1 hypothetical protein [Microbacterium sp. SD291]